MTAGSTQTEAELIDQLHLYVEARNTRGIASKYMDDLGRGFKAWLEEHPEDELVDAERGFHAYLKEQNAPGRVCDFNALLDNDLILLTQLVRNGCLRLDEEAVKRAGALVGGLDRYLAPKGKTKSLHVEEIK